MEKTIEQLEHKKTKLENKVSELKSKIEAIEKRNSERKEVEAKKREHEVEFLKYQEAHLAKFLKQVSEKARNWIHFFACQILKKFKILDPNFI